MIAMKHINNRSTAKAAIFLRTFCLSLLLIGFSSSVFAATYTWDGGASTSNWSDLNNWDDGGGDPSILPGSSDDVVINIAATTIVDASFTSSKVNSITLSNSSATITLAKDLTARGNVTITSGALDISTHIFSVEGSLTNSGTLTASSGTLAFFPVNANEYFTVSGSGTSTINTLEVSNNTSDYNTLNITSGSPLSLAVVNLNVIASLDIGSNITLNISNKVELKNIASSVSVNGTLSYQSGSELVYTASLTTGDEWPSSGSVPQNVKVDNSATVTLNESKSIAKNFNMSSGTLAMGTNGLTILGTVSGSDIQGGSIVTGTGGFVIGNGSGAQFDQTITGNIILPNATVNKNHTNNNLGISGTVTVNGDFIVNYGDVTVTGVLTVSGSNSLAVNNTSTFSNSNSTKVSLGTLQLGGSSTFENGTGSTAFDAQTITLTGSATYKTGGKTAAALTTLNLSSTSTFEFNGNGGQENTPLAAGATYGNLTVNNADGINVVGDVVINGTLTFSIDNGLVDVTSGNTLTLSTTAGVTNASASRYVNGPLQIEFNGTSSKIFPIGVSGSGSSAYRPATFQYATNPSPAQTIEMEYIASNPAGNLPSGISQIATGGHYTLQNITGTSTSNYNITLRYTDAGISPESKTRILVQNGSGPDYSVPGTQSQNETNDDVTATGVTTMPSNDFILAFGQGGSTTTWSATAASTDWATASNWDNGVPTSVDDAVIQSSTNNPVIGNGDGASVNTLNIQSGASLTFSDVTDINVASTASGALTVAGIFTINTSAIVNFNSSGYNASATDYSGTVIYGSSSSVQPDTYTNLQVNGGSGNASGTTTVTGNYTNTSGTPSFNNLDIAGDMTLTAGSPAGTISVQGDIISNGGNVAGTVTMDGTTGSQSISGTGFTFNNLVIDNSDGVSLAASATPTIDGTLTLTNGILNTATGTSLALSKSTSGGSSTSYISGPVLANLTGTTLLEIATGDNAVQRSIALKNSVSGSTSYQVQFIEGEHPDAYNITGTTVLAVSKLYYWSVERLTGSVDADLTLNWETPGDGISNPAAIMIARYESGWVDQGSGTGSGTSVTSPLSVFAQRYYTLGSTNIVDNPLPVELVSFDGVSTNNGITLNWETASEKDSRGFILSRKMSGSSEWEVASTYAGNSALESTNSLTGSKYSVTDYIEIAAGETVQYQLEEEDIAGIRTVLETITVESQYSTTIESYNLSQNYPNPFNPSTTIGYELKDNARVNIVVYNALGQAVKTLVNENQNRGRYSVQFNAGGLSSGIYFYRMIVSGNNVNYTDVRKMMLVK